MIVEYQRPKTIDEALRLLSRTEPLTLPLGGGTALNRWAQAESQAVAVVDLQALGLNKIEMRGSNLHLGAAVTLQDLLDHPGLPAMLYEAVRLEATHNLRQAATLAGTLASADGRSPLTTVMLALDATLTIRKASGTEKIGLGSWLPLRRAGVGGGLITEIVLAAAGAVKLSYEYVARTPADRPIVCAAVAQWPAGRTRLALGGWGAAPLLAMDGPEPGGVEAAAHNAYSQAGDQWASAEYRAAMAVTLAKRCLG